MQLLKPILAGVLIGAALYFMPFFVLRVVTVVLIVTVLFRIFGGRKFRGGFNARFTDNIRNMSDEEYRSFKQNYAASCSWNSNPASTANNESK